MLFTKIRFYVLSLALIMCSAAMLSCTGSEIIPSELVCEYAENPLIDIQNPLL